MCISGNFNTRMLTAAETQELQKKNPLCADCETKDVQWADVSHGILLCLQCAGEHRSLGVTIARVKSITMDDWSASELERMNHGGNAALSSYFKASFVKRSLRTMSGDTFESWKVEQKYESNTAEAFREKLNLLVHGTLSLSTDAASDPITAGGKLLRQLSCPPEYTPRLPQQSQHGDLKRCATAPISTSSSIPASKRRQKNNYDFVYWQVTCNRGLSGGVSLFDSSASTSKKFRDGDGRSLWKKRSCMDCLQDYIYSMALTQTN